MSDARQTLSDIVNTVAYGGRRVILARHGRDLVAIVPVADLNRLEAMVERATGSPARLGRPAATSTPTSARRTGPRA